MRNDLLLVLRGLARAPLTAALAAAALCAGVAVILSIFTVARGVLLRGLPYPDGERLVLVWRGTAQQPEDRSPLSPPDFLDLRDQAGSFRSVAAVNSFGTTFVPAAGDPEQVVLGVVAGDFFGTLGVRPLLGRTLEPSDDRPLNTRDSTAVGVVVLDHGFWTRAFDADPQILGRTIDMGGSRMTVVGVMPPSFRLHMPAGAGMSTDFVGWTPLGIDYANAPRDGAYLKVIARLAVGVTPERAQAELDGIAGRLRGAAREHEEAGLTLRAASLEREVTAHIRPILLLLVASGALLLLVACANAATLLLVRFLSRRGEVAIRQALGANRRRLLRPLLLESTAIALGGSLAGVLLARPAVTLLLRLEPGIVPRTGPLDVDAAAVAAALALALVLALACGIGPALLVTRGELAGALRAQRSAGTPGAQRLRRGVVVLQAAAAFALLYGSATLLGTLVRLQRSDLGFAGGDVLTARVTLPFARYPGPDRWVAFFSQLTDRLGSAPGVRAVAVTSDLPIDGYLGQDPYSPAEQPAGEAGPQTALYRIVGPGYFATVGVPILAGRTFTDADRDGGPGVVVVDEALARMLAAHAPGPVPGRRLSVTVSEFREGYRVVQRTAEIVGVVGTVPQEHPDAPPPGTIYMPHAQYPLWSMVVVVAGEAGVPGLRVVREALDELDPRLPLASVRPLRAVVDEALAPTRFLLALVGALGLAVIVLTAAGLFGVVAETVRQRRRELAVRLAVGAPPASLARRILRGGIALAVGGIVPGVPLALAAGRMLERGVAGVSGFAPAAGLAAALALLAIAAAACLPPAWRAGRMDPLRVLREE